MVEPQADVDIEAGVREHYLDAALYDYEYRRRRDDVRFYLDLAAQLGPEPGPILELACGSGRVTAPLLRAGHSVVGVDLSAPMLARAHRRLARLDPAAQSRAALIQADMRRFALARRFPLVVMTFNSFEHLYTRVDIRACLACVRRHLQPSGHFIFDVQNPNLRWLSRKPTRRWGRAKFTHPETKERLVYSTNHTYDPVRQIAMIRLYYQPLDSGRVERVTRLSQRKFFPAELEALVSQNGFRMVRRHGDFHGGPLCGDSYSQVLVCSPHDRTDRGGE